MPAVVLVAACAAIAPGEPPVPALAGHPPIEVPDVDLLRTSPEMRAFVRQHAVQGDSKAGKAWKLAYAVLDPYVLPFNYDADLTLPADEAFRTGRGNCLTFSSMLVALARDAGVEAWFQEVIVPPNWSAVDETLLVGKHVNAVVAGGARRYTVDVSQRKRTPLEETRQISDAEAQAQYYNNLGVNDLLGGDLPRAHAWFGKALAAHGRLDYVWSNLGVTFRRNGQTTDAILAYRTAIRLEPENAEALNNLHALYTEEGDLEAAAAIARRVEHNRRKNPYYLYHLAEAANTEERWSDAIELLNRAIRLEADEYRFHYALAKAQYAVGESKKASVSLARARGLAPAAPPEGPLTLPGSD